MQRAEIYDEKSWRKFMKSNFPLDILGDERRQNAMKNYEERQTFFFK